MDYAELRSLLSSVAATDYNITILNNDVWEINVFDPDAYRALTRVLNAGNIQWHTYENKSERPIRVMARGIHASYTKDDIMNDLNKKSYKIINAVNIIKKEKQTNDKGEQIISKRGLPLFMLTFNNQEKMEKIYEIKKILNIAVKIEPLRRNMKAIPQCKRCKCYNHTQAYCCREPRCVECAGKHLTTNCNISKQTAPKCVNYKGMHPANYRGCEVAKELQRRRDQLMKPIKKVTQLSNNDKLNKPKKEERKKEKRITFGEKTFAQVTRTTDNKGNKKAWTHSHSFLANWTSKSQQIK